MENEIVVSGFMAPVVSVKDALIAYQAKKDLIDGIMRDGVDYGVIPGTNKPTLLKAGAEKATSFFGLSTRFKDAGTVEDWTGEAHGGEPFFFYRLTCELWRGDFFVASADGSCNSWEKKYRYRSSSRVCPTCGKETIIKGKEEYGGGWLCFAKKGGCGAKFKDGDSAVEGQSVGQVKNEDTADLVNTILKMAEKRALVAATLIATGLSEYFTQDVEDYATPEVVTAIPKAEKPVMTYEQAVELKSPKGLRFGDMDRTKLEYMANKGNAEQAEAALVILAHDFQVEPVEDPAPSQ